jgi:hypothetical protein
MVTPWRTQADAGHHVLQRTARRVVIQHFRGRDDRQAVTTGAASQPLFFGQFRIAAMARHHGVKAIAERVVQRAGNGLGVRIADQQTGITTPECEQAGRMQTDFVPGHE